MENFLKDDLTNNNIPIPDVINPKGFTRWGHNNQYWLVQCGKGYIFGNWVDDSKIYSFQNNSVNISTADRYKTECAIAEQRRLFIEEQNKIHNKVSETAKDIFDKSSEVPLNHSYLSKKQIKPYGIKYNTQTNSLIIPLYDSFDKLWTLQYITSDGQKRFLAEGRKKGCFYPLGSFTNTVVICEGFATATSIYEATKYYTVAAMDAGNLKHVAQSIRAKYPNSTIIIAADNDWEKETNIGVKKAQEAADMIEANICIPQKLEHGMSDFNDIAIKYGINEVKNQIATANVFTSIHRDYGFTIVTADNFLTKELPKTEFLLYPLVPSNGVSLLYAERGAGKTFMALAIACAVASGFDFLNFKASKPRKVLYVDGEMDAREMQDRLNLLITGFASENKNVIKENISLFLAGMQSNANMPRYSNKTRTVSIGVIYRK